MARQTSQDLKEVIRDFRRDQIIDVARHLFGERGSTDVSMDEIASEAGVARSTIYVYFANRDELIRACLKRMYDQLVDTVSDRWDLVETPIEKLQLLVVGLFEQVDTSPAFVRLAFATYETLAPAGAAVGSELAMIGLDVVGRIRELFDEGVASGAFRSIDPDRAVTLIGQQIYGAMSVRAADALPRPGDEAATEICDFVLRGLTG
ncbi:MAG TPA: TetR/AcrR family transcriptional regulator [Acidimicrobiales bacterium]|nr:TetR/AcrR family transcriptional regulator [Acidimicrobiales bacterium]